MIIAKRIKEMRIEKKLTQKQLAEQVGQCYKHDKICGKHESCESYETRINKPAIKRGVVIDGKRRSANRRQAR